MKDRDLDFDKKVKEVEQIKVKVDQKYTQMRKEKEENLKRMDLMDSEIQQYRDKFSMNLIEMEANLIKMD